MEGKSEERWVDLKDDYSALIMARIANSITQDYERLAGDIAEQ